DGWSARRQQPSEGDDEGVRVIATKDELDRKVEGQTIASRWLETLAAHPDNVALRSKDGDRWIEWAFGDLGDRGGRGGGGGGLRGPADDAQHPRVPRGRPRDDVLRRHRGVDLQLLAPRAGRLPGRAQRRHRRDRRGHGLRR